MSDFISIDGMDIPLEGEKNLLQVIRKAGIEIPTFCYHSELSIYGACRLCIVEIEGKGIEASCSTPPRAGMKVRTNSDVIRETRRMTLELLLANHNRECPTCERSSDCVLRDLASRYGIDTIRFRRTREVRPLDNLSDSLVRDPNKCVLCGDCVRFCHEVQGIGAIDFAFRGEHVQVTPAFGKSLGEVDCIECGQCAAVCPTGAIIPKPEIDAVWKLLHDREQTVAVQIAPAVRVALGEIFNLEADDSLTRKMVRALRMLGFEQVYDTGFAADLTVVEEAEEFRRRLGSASQLPLMTSCCPAWVKFAEHSLPGSLGNLSSCMSPQSMLGSLMRNTLPEKLGIDPGRLKIVSVMPCTAKKFEKGRPELSRDSLPHVDHVITTAELGKMIREAGIRLGELEGDSFDLPFGVASRLGVGFGAGGGVAEAVLAYLGAETGPEGIEWKPLSQPGAKAAEFLLDGTVRKAAVVQGIRSAAAVAEAVERGELALDLLEVMACPGGCVGGAGQPMDRMGEKRSVRSRAVRQSASSPSIEHAGGNTFVKDLYREHLNCSPGDEKAHSLFHTAYKSRKRISGMDMALSRGRIPVKVCVGTSCFLRGSQKVLAELLHTVEEEGLEDFFEIQATFCSEKCDKGPTVKIGEREINRADGKMIASEMRAMAAGV